VPYYLIAERYTDQWKVLPFALHEAMGIPVFEEEERARGFIDANWESLGPSWYPQELSANLLVYVLERYADEEEVQWIVLDPPPAAIASVAGIEEVEVMGIRLYIEKLREFHNL
jgi:hypothetical protein